MEYGVGEKFNQSTKQNETNKNEKKKKPLVWDGVLNSMLHLELCHLKKKKESLVGM